MTIELDAATEQLLQRELADGRFADANELIAHALLRLSHESEAAPQDQMDSWLLRNREAIRKALDESSAARDRGEGLSPDELKSHFAARRAARANHAA